MKYFGVFGVIYTCLWPVICLVTANAQCQAKFYVVRPAHAHVTPMCVTTVSFQQKVKRQPSSTLKVLSCDKVWRSDSKICPTKSALKLGVKRHLQKIQNAHEKKPFWFRSMGRPLAKPKGAPLIFHVKFCVYGHFLKNFRGSAPLW